MRDIKGWALLCTTNDPESLTIVRIARALKIPLLESKQMHGATLAQEPEIGERLRALGAVEHLAIVEIPGPEQEAEMASQGIEVHVIDHHTYEGLDRMRDVASLTQFLELLKITDGDLVNAGYDPDVIRGIALIDQGFVWELGRSNLSTEKQQEVRAQYLACKREIQPQYAEIEQDAQRAWEERKEQGNVVIVTSQSPHHIREAVSFCVADAYSAHPPTSIIIESDGRISVQETDAAERLFATYGGFLFGKKRCWGMVGKDHPPSVDKIMANICG